jgi:GrpB-like predicted nucleotidyltransferase (UPF0157 family)
MKAPVIIEDYDPRWPERFEALRARIGSALRPLAATIEHVGSTAVPGLAAKPIIDIEVLLRSQTDLPRAIKRLTTLGYEHQGDLGIAGREAFRAPTGVFPHHLYVCSPDSRQYGRHIAFRNHLRGNPEDARAYERLKRSLADRFGNDRDAYTLGKTDFIDAILQRAEPVVSEHFRRGDRIIS